MTLTRKDLMGLEQYSTRARNSAPGCWSTSANRSLALGPNATWAFEDALTMQYQVQEMLRVERIFEADAIQEELDAYNPLIPDGSNWKVTFLLEFPDVDERRQRLAQLKGVEDRCWVQVAGQERVWAIADEDLERENEEKTSSVHFLRFELTDVVRTTYAHPLAGRCEVDGDEFTFDTHPRSAGGSCSTASCATRRRCSSRSSGSSPSASAGRDGARSADRVLASARPESGVRRDAP
ncbi:MAG: DUF3501 family protein, partial [Gammaproteobacteria bacterium]|nr:DUF3501 family protein [Gammaproteobacteria bacterium]